MRQSYRLTVTQEHNYVSVEARYYGPANVNILIEHRYSAAIDSTVAALFESAYNVECLSRKTVSDVRSHEYRLDAKMYPARQVKHL